MIITTLYWAAAIYQALFGQYTEHCLKDDYTVSIAPVKNNVAAVQDGSTRFAIKFLQEMATKKTGTTDNILISPISLWAALTVTYLGARGNTATEMRTVLNFHGVHKPDLTNAYEEFRDRLLHNATATSNYTFDLANKIYFDKNVPLKECIFHTNLISQLEKVDFGDKLEEARQAINKWVESKTNDRIKELIRASDVDRITKMVIVNAAYFKGFWQVPFSVTFQNSDFFVTPGQPVKVDMMSVTKRFRVGYDSALDCSALELPYVGNEVSMLILLPNTTVEDLIPKLTAENVNGLYQKLESKFLDVYVPKFKFEQATDLKTVVQGMGVSDLFSPGLADLSGFTGDKSSYVKFIRQKAFIEVKEEGTKAAATTAIGVMAYSLLVPEREPFVCNKPFVFFIRHNSAGTILFSGVVRKPEYQN